LFGEEGIPWEIADFLGTGNRAERAARSRAEKIESDLQLMKLQRGLSSITRNTPATAEQLPAWAERKWDPKDYPHLFGAGKAN
jgi:hypothetical protein